MEKLKLDVDSLRVDSFAPVPERHDGGGTVRAFEMTIRTVCSCPSGCGPCTGNDTYPPPF